LQACKRNLDLDWLFRGGAIGPKALAQEDGSKNKSLFYALILLLSFLFYFNSLRISGGDIAINNPYTDIACHHAYVRTIGALAGAILAFPQILHFSSSAEALSGYPRIKIGFEAGGSVMDIVGCYTHNIGIKLFLYGLAFFVIEKRWRADLAIFLAPLLIANVLQLGVALYGNNKLMWISLTFVMARFWEKLKSLGWGREDMGIPAFLSFLIFGASPWPTGPGF
jgi:hypothetical protein